MTGFGEYTKKLERHTGEVVDEAVTRAFYAAGIHPADAAQMLSKGAVTMEEMKQHAVVNKIGNSTHHGMIPDRVSIEKGNPHYWPGYKHLGVKIDGEIRRADVVEFCVSEGWAMVHVKDKYGRKQADPDRPGFLLNTRVEGMIEPYWIDKDQKKAEPGDAARLAAAEAKRQRKAARLMGAQ